jgi:iron complex outermembrane recepter protein
MARAIVDFEPADGVKFELNANGWIDRSETQAPVFYGYNIQSPPQFADPYVTPANFTPENPRSADWTPGFTSANNKFGQISLRGDIDLGDFATLTSITSYSYYRQRQSNDMDGLPIVLLDLNHDDGSIKNFSQELRLSNGSRGRFRWVAGGNFERSKVNEFVNQSFPNASSHYFFGSIGYPIEVANFYTNQNMKNFAFFANGEFDVTSTITVKGGARYTKTMRDSINCTEESSGRTDQLGSLIYDVILGGAFGRYTPGACYSINNLTDSQGRPTTWNGVPFGAPGLYKGNLNQDNVSWRVGVDWKPTSDILVYANVSRGYKAGSFPATAATAFVQYQPVSQESVLAYEAGFKTKLIDRTLQFNGAGFYYDYSDKQLRAKFVDPVFSILDNIQNIPKSSIKGFELELTATPTRGLVVNTALTYLDATIDKFTGINAAGVNASFNGTRMPYTPKWQVGTNADYSFPVGGLVGALGFSIAMRSDTPSVVGGDFNPPAAVGNRPELYVMPGYATLDLRASITRDGAPWRVSIWGKNVTNTFYYTNEVANFDSIVGYAGRPATYGVTLSYKM